ncbi:MAG: hypothetical protein K9M10_03420 [Candidatus Pacebacteria bacterium]|nr:hypothetical protein [Candidatus Paceibacterota bacterium]MCF7857504.1 hypothetical protein [Candidatus Paceibacterota bacterium]
MPYVPDENDLAVKTYGVDLERLARFLYEKFTDNDWDAFVSAASFWWNIYSVIAIILSLVFIIGFVYAKIRYGQLSDLEQEALREAEAQWAATNESGDTKNTRWDSILAHVADNRPESWRIAIIEADILLDETLSKAGYVGQSIGDKLKTANTQSFTTIQDAWEAHKVRNDIAHVGSDFVLTKKSAQETIVRFERVFREFGVI